MTLSAAILAVMLSLPSARPMPGHEETAEAMRVRYASIAADIAAVVTTPEDAALLLAVTYHESAWAHDVDTGACYRGPWWERRCDSGRAVCIAQLQLPRREREEARTDRRTCLSMGLAAIRRSLSTCASSTPPHRFAGLSGSCSRGLAGSRRIHAIRRRVDGLLTTAISSPGT